ncbi:MAG TPA: CBS domain-containing protein, partial [Gaiellaceae bacterium]|nr:CBS domain-containing protein [Gaiellaceae bacterium]
GPSTVRPSARLEAIVERMRRQKLTTLPVTRSDGRLVGLLTLRDAEQAAAATRTVGRMTEHRAGGLVHRTLEG